MLAGRRGTHGAAAGGGRALTSPFSPHTGAQHAQDARPYGSRRALAAAALVPLAGAASAADPYGTPVGHQGTVHGDPDNDYTQNQNQDNDLLDLDQVLNDVLDLDLL